jgi:hypothetical protein
MVLFNSSKLLFRQEVAIDVPFHGTRSARGKGNFEIENPRL